MTKDEALKDLLKIVEHAIEIGDWKVDGRCDPDLAINRAKEALEQPAQEPVAWMPIESAPKDGTMILVKLPRMMNLVVRARYNTIHKFWMNDYEGEGGIINPYYYHEGDLWHPIPTDTHPAPSWQGLSDDEIRAIDDVTLGDYYVEELATKFARAIEQELRSKNART